MGESPREFESRSHRLSMRQEIKQRFEEVEENFRSKMSKAGELKAGAERLDSFTDHELRIYLKNS